MCPESLQLAAFKRQQAQRILGLVMADHGEGRIVVVLNGFRECLYLALWHVGRGTVEIAQRRRLQRTDQLYAVAGMGELQALSRFGIAVNAKAIEGLRRTS